MIDPNSAQVLAPPAESPLAQASRGIPSSGEQREVTYDDLRQSMLRLQSNPFTGSRAPSSAPSKD